MNFIDLKFQKYLEIVMDPVNQKMLYCFDKWPYSTVYTKIVASVCTYSSCYGCHGNK